MDTRELLSSWMKWKTVKEAKEYTQAQLSADSGISKASISKMLNRGGKIRNATQMKLAKAFGVDIQQFGWGPFFQEDKMNLDLKSKAWKLFNAIEDKRLLTIIYNNIAVFHLYEKNIHDGFACHEAPHIFLTHMHDQLAEYLIGAWNNTTI